jgi:transposase
MWGADMVQPPDAQEAVPMGLDIPPADWQQTPPSVQTLVLTLLKRLEAVEARLTQDSTTSQRPPSADSPYQKARKPAGDAPPRKAGGQPGHPGHRQSLLAPSDTRVLTPHQCACGNTALALTRPYHTHQVLELPIIQMDMIHFVLQEAWCPVCAQWTKAQVPPEHTAGYGPRLTALVGEIAGTHGTSRRTIQAFCASVLQIPLSLGAIQKMLDWVTQAIEPHYGAIASQARRAPVNYIDETPWFLTNTLHWLWVMANETVAFYMVHPHRSKAAFAALIEDWAGLLVSDGYGVYQTWVAQRQTCLAHLIRTARGLAERQSPDLATCGAWALAELQRLCHMATAPPTGGEWRAWYARLCRLIDQYHDRPDEAGRFVRRLLRELDSLWVFLVQHGVEPTNNRAERALRFGVLWRKRSHGTASEKGNRWVERILSLKETCRLRTRSTYTVLVDAVTSFFYGHPPELSWLT